MDYGFRKEFYEAEQRISEFCVCCHNMVQIFRDNSLLDGLNQKLNGIYKGFIRSKIREKKQIFDEQMKNYTNEMEKEKAKLSFQDAIVFCDSLMKLHYQWI